MKIIDCHVHLGQTLDVETAKDWLQQSGAHGCHLFSINPMHRPDGGRASIENLGAVARELPGRIVPFAWIDPLHADAVRIARWAIEHCGCAGFKMIPAGWYPDDPKAKAIYAAAEELGVPIQFHSGILWLAGDNSKYNRPAGYEALWDYPGVRFSLAHISWPWTDECIAVVQKFKVLNGRDEARDSFQAMIDLTPGTPLIYRRDALHKALQCTGVDFLMFGSDSGIPRGYLPEAKCKRDAEMLHELGCTDEDLEKIFHGNAERFVTRPPSGAQA